MPMLLFLIAAAYGGETSVEVVSGENIVLAGTLSDVSSTVSAPFRRNTITVRQTSFEDRVCVSASVSKRWRRPAELGGPCITPSPTGISTVSQGMGKMTLTLRVDMGSDPKP